MSELAIFTNMFEFLGANPMPYDVTLMGQIEKIFSTYGFVSTTDGHRYFFHFGTCASKPELFRVGDFVQFVLGKDIKTHRIHAQKVRRIQAQQMDENLSPAVAAILKTLPYAPPITPSQSMTISPGRNLSSVTSADSLCDDTCKWPSVVLGEMDPSLELSPNCTNSTIDRDNRGIIKASQSENLSFQFELPDQRGIIVVAPKDADPNSTSGTVACEINGVPVFAKFRCGNLQYGFIEKPLLSYGKTVTFTASWNQNLNCWFANSIVPEEKIHRGVVVDIIGFVMIIEEYYNRNTGSGLYYSCPISKRPAMIWPKNTWVEFVVVPDEKLGAILSRVKEISFGYI